VEGRIEPRHAEAGSSLVRVHSGKFELETRGEGIFKARVFLQGEFQTGSLRKTLARESSARKWEFELPGTDTLSRLQLELESVRLQIAEVQEFYSRVEAACRNRHDWEGRSKEFLTEASTLLRRETRGEAICTAARADRRDAVGWFLRNSQHFYWRPDGSFGGAFDPEALE